MKEFFQTDKVNIIHGSCTELSVIDPDSVDLIVTSPPYNVGIEYGDHDDSMNYDEYMSFCRDWISNCFSWMKDTGRMCLNVPFETIKGGRKSVSSDLIQVSKSVGFNYCCTIIWNKGAIPRVCWGTFMSPTSPYMFTPVESIVVLHKGEWKKDKTGETDLLRDEFVKWTDCMWNMHCENRVRLGHPAPFPLELPRRCIKLFSFVGDTVLDPFLGSGSTMVSAFRLDRKSIGIELDEKYCNLAMRRIKREIKIRKGYIF